MRSPYETFTAPTPMKNQVPMPISSIETPPPKKHPKAVFSRVASLCANGDIEMHLAEERTLELFMAFKLALPSVDDHTAALLTLASTVARHPSI